MMPRNEALLTLGPTRPTFQIRGSISSLESHVLQLLYWSQLFSIQFALLICLINAFVTFHQHM